MRTVGALLRDESGATAIEHRLIGIVATGQGIGP
jgi:Flp pilus assembly pilin Flp